MCCVHNYSILKRTRVTAHVHHLSLSLSLSLSVIQTAHSVMCLLLLKLALLALCPLVCRCSPQEEFPLITRTNSQVL